MMAWGLALAASAAGGDAPTRHAQAVTAYRVAAWARARHDPQALLAAARMVADAGVRSEDRRPAADALADEAQAMAPDDAAVAAAAAAIRDARGRGVIRGPLGDGPIAMRRTISGGGTFGWPVFARGGEKAIVSAVGDGDTNVDLAVSKGRATVCRDAGADAYPVCHWHVAKDAEYRVAVSNRGRVATTVTVLSN